jgi:hypothetical protein
MVYDRHFAVRDRARSLSLGTMIAGGTILAALLAIGLLKVEGQEAPKAPVQVQPKTAAEFHEKIEPLLVSYCYECHGFGEKKGEIKLDANGDRLIGDVQLWSKVLKNVRSRVMPPAGSDRPNAAEVETLANWIKYRAFEIDPADIDPGRVTIHRLNRNEYRNTIHDLLGIDYNAADELPPDASGLGFDNIADLLSVSPLMLEKYLDAAEAILDGAFPTEAAHIIAADGGPMRGNGNGPGRRLGFYGSPEVTFTYRNDHPGKFQLVLQLQVLAADPPPPEIAKPQAEKADAKADGSKPDAKTDDAKSEAKTDEAKAEPPKPEPPKPGHLTVACQSGVSEKVVLLWQDFLPETNSYEFAFEQNWTTEPHKIDFNVIASGPAGARRGFGGGGARGGPAGPRFVIKSLTVKPQQSELAKRFFPLDAPPSGNDEFREYVRKGITEFGLRTYRRPIDATIVERLVADIEKSYRDTSHFYESLKPALAKLLCSPRFLFRIDRTAETHDAEHRWAPVDEYSLASRLSYFLWASMPDDELLDMARRNELRANLPAQLERMLASEKSHRFVEDFSGQWLQTRNVLNWSIVEKAVLDREGIRSFRPVLTPAIRQAMVNETTLFFSRIVHEDRSVQDFIDSDYTYMNEDLAKYYKISGVTGPEMRLVQLTKDNHRGGVLTQGSMLLVTSNANRTSAVKRGVFVLDKFLGLRPHDPPPNLPSLEDASKAIKDHDPTFREMLELHRADTLCASCHKLMDPIGLAMENFNALGLYRDKEFNQPIDASGTLITGEEFKGIDELKQVLLTSHRTNFYRCLAEKMLTYGLGRELGYHDCETVDQIVARLDAENGKFSALLMGIVDSAPFQKRRLNATPPAADRLPSEPLRGSP